MSKGREVKVRMKFDGESQHGSYWQHLWHRWRWWVVFRWLVCLASVSLGGILLVGGEKNVLGAFLVSIGSIGCMRPMVWGMWQERGLRKHPAYGGEVNYVFSEDGVEMDGKAGSAVVPWASFYEVKSVKKGLLIYQDKKQYLWLPSKAFNRGEMQSVVRLWERAQG